jgi:hypothetical protein
LNKPKSQNSSDFLYGQIKLRPNWPLGVFRTELQAKTIFFLLREYMQMKVENLRHQRRIIATE